MITGTTPGTDKHLSDVYTQNSSPEPKIHRSTMAEDPPPAAGLFDSSLPKRN